MSIFGTKKTAVRLIAILTVTALIFGAALVYVFDYYRADTEAIDAFISEAKISEREYGGGILAFGEETSECGFIFYPGGKVEYTSYIPLAVALAARGVFTVLLPMPLNLAVLDVNAADGISEMFPDISRWYIGGHSLGGSMAASYAASHSGGISGIVLLASYSTSDISRLPVLSVYGSCDGVMNRDKYGKYRSNLPSDFTEYVIDGGSHAYFGMYGEQDGDGEASITPYNQITLTADYISSFCLSVGGR